jgi:hypothetical protein
MVVPDKYVKEGFDQARIDTVVFIIIESNNSESYVAAASPCIKTRRPIYGYIIFNAAFVKPAWNKPAAFHQNIYITVLGKLFRCTSSRTSLASTNSSMLTSMSIPAAPPSWGRNE